ncbi:MAG: D-alanine--D-alanine ligase family protein [Myxococcota bacterium]
MPSPKASNHRIRMLVLAGGRSDEHEVSIVSTRSLLEALEGSTIEATAVVITREGRWLSGPGSRQALSDGKATSGGELALHRARVAEEFDVVFPLLHGPYGEDGTVQGMLELADLPYVGSGVLSSSLCMDKPMAKDVLRTHGIPQVGYALITRRDVEQDADAAIARCSELAAPWFVKPANLGSSVGITRVCDAGALHQAIEVALQYDRRVIVEASAVDARELEVAILGNDDVRASPVGEITYASDFYDYDTKYTEGCADLHIPADIPDDVSKRIQELAIRAFGILDCAGFARVDFFYQPSVGTILLNEVNTIPGFTPFSMFTKLWEAGGLAYAELVHRLVDLAIERHRERQRPVRR